MSSSQSVDFPVRLVGGPHNCSGRVEIYFRGRWGTVCENWWSLNDAMVVARELGCGRVLSAPRGAYFGQGTGDILLEWVHCSGSESKLSQCSRSGMGMTNCAHNQDAGILTEGKYKQMNEYGIMKCGALHVLPLSFKG